MNQIENTPLITADEGLANMIALAEADSRADAESIIEKMESAADWSIQHWYIFAIISLAALIVKNTNPANN